MKRKYKYTLIVELLGFIGSYIIYAFCTGRLDIWNLPDGLFRMFLASTIFIGVIFGIFINLVENELYK
jgi:hypothetical protein|nr:MAG TPA: hypothetical protein [Caudoviricetes sp.]